MITHRPDCTLAESTPTGFVNAPPIRTTMQIVWSCLSVILLCTWSILHLNVPPDMETKGKWQWVRKKLYLALRKVHWMIVMLWAPEFLTIITARKVLCTRRNHKPLKEEAFEDDVPWELVHTILADMGGFAIRFPGHQMRAADGSREETSAGSLRPAEQSVTEARINTSLEAEAPQQGEGEGNIPPFVREFRENQKLWVGDCKIPWEPYEGHFQHAIRMKNELPEDRLKCDTENIAALAGSVWVLDSRQLLLAKQHGVINSLPRIETSQIDDKNKSDALVKFLAILQVLWLVVQLIGRRINKLPFAPLEISTVAYSVSAFILYVLEWYKPKDVNIPVYIDAAKSTVKFEVFKEIVEEAPFPYGQIPGFQTKNYHIPDCAFHYTKRERLKKLDWTAFIVTSTTIVSFGGVHFFAWNLKFPTDTEQLLWRICAIVTVCMPVIYTVSHASFMGKLPKDISMKTANTVKATVLLTSFFYSLARSYLIVESVRSLYYLPHDVFIANWASNIPHVA